MNFVRHVAAFSVALVASAADAQCTKDTDCKGDRVCTAGACVDPRMVPPERAPSLVVAKLDAQRPSLYWPITSLVVGAVTFITGLAGWGLTADTTWVITGSAIGGAALFGGLVSLFTTLWSRAAIGRMMDEAEGRG